MVRCTCSSNQELQHQSQLQHCISYERELCLPPFTEQQLRCCWQNLVVTPSWRNSKLTLCPSFCLNVTDYHRQLNLLPHGLASSKPLVLHTEDAVASEYCAAH